MPRSAVGHHVAGASSRIGEVRVRGGGGMLLLAGILAALWHAGRSGRGQVVDAATVDGVSVLSQKVWSWLAQGLWTDEREATFIDGLAPWSRTYACADGKFMVVGAIEPQFYAELLRGLGWRPSFLV